MSRVELTDVEGWGLGKGGKKNTMEENTQGNEEKKKPAEGKGEEPQLRKQKGNMLASSMPNLVSAGGDEIEMLSKLQKTVEETLTRMRDILITMQETFQNQKNVNKVIKDGVPQLIAWVDETKAISGSLQRRQVQLFAQLPERPQKKAERKQPLAKAENQERPGPSRKRGAPVSPTGDTGSKKVRMGSSPPMPSQSAKVQDPWTKVEKRRRSKRGKAKAEPKKREKKAALKPDAVKIVAAGEMSYADIIKKLSGSEALQSQKAVEKIRRTKKDELLIVLKKNAESAKFRDAAAVALGQNAQLTTLSSKKTIEIRDIDETVEKATVLEKVKELLPENQGVAMECTLVKSYGGTQAALVTLPSREAMHLIEKKRVLIGLVSCRMRIRVEVHRCAKCSGFGHKSFSCKKEGDKDRCWKCGEIGHKSKTCAQPEKCLACHRAGRDDKHKPGSSKCPSFREVLERLRKKENA